MGTIATLEEIQGECQTMIDETETLTDRLESIWWDIKKKKEEEIEKVYP